jgi:hypothetical protein
MISSFCIGIIPPLIFCLLNRIPIFFCNSLVFSEITTLFDSLSSLASIVPFSRLKSSNSASVSDSRHIGQVTLNEQTPCSQIVFKLLPKQKTNSTWFPFNFVFYSFVLFYSYFVFHVMDMFNQTFQMKIMLTTELNELYNLIEIIQANCANT